MRQMFLKVMGALILGNLVLLSACNKKDDGTLPPPENPPPVLSHAVQWTMETLPGEPQGPVSNLFALVSVENSQGQSILTNKKLAISYSGKFRTEELELPAGNHKVTSFLVVNGSNQVLFAAPKSNSAKANFVSRPLPVSFVLPQPVLLGVAMEVLRIQTGDTPESFGYPAGTFNNGGQNPPGDGNNFVKVKLRAAIQVGEIHYDSIPATILYTYWDENQQSFGKYITLAAGTNEVSLSRSAIKHHFRMSKWGTDYQLSLLKDEIQEGNLYTLGGAKMAKKLKAELVYKLVDGTYKPDTRTVFNYGTTGRLSEIQYYARKQDNTPYLANRESFEYSHNQLQKINRYDEYNNFTGATSFSYNTTGKISRIAEEALTGVQTVATVGYYYAATTRLTEVTFNYTYSNSPISMNYYQRYRDGNRIEDNSNSSNQSTETGRYDYDSQVNPYVHMGWPDLFLSHYSKNNVTNQQKTYYGNYPVAVAYSFSYKYDAEGYPVELLRQYKSYITGQHLYSTKTVFQY